MWLFWHLQPPAARLNSVMIAFPLVSFKKDLQVSETFAIVTSQKVPCKSASTEADDELNATYTRAWKLEAKAGISEITELPMKVIPFVRVIEYNIHMELQFIKVPSSKKNRFIHSLFERLNFYPFDDDQRHWKRLHTVPTRIQSPQLRVTLPPGKKSLQKSGNISRMKVKNCLGRYPRKIKKKNNNNNNRSWFIRT